MAHLIIVGPPLLDFGQVCLRSITTKNLNIVNNLDRHVLVVAQVGPIVVLLFFQLIILMILHFKISAVYVLI